MDKYIKQLIELMRSAYQNRPEQHYSADLEDHFAEIEAYISGNFDQQIDESIGIPQHCFPPDDQLTDEQIDLLAPEFEALWNHFRFHLCFPEKINARWKYILMRKELAEIHQILKSENSMMHIEFCDYDANQCTLPREFCCGGFMED
jgi:hypothetical protein